mgnify:CR=1 FL=1
MDRVRHYFSPRILPLTGSIVLFIFLGYLILSSNGLYGFLIVPFFLLAFLVAVGLSYREVQAGGSSARQALDYYNQALRESGSRAPNAMRLFMLPGVSHCGGGSGAMPLDSSSPPTSGAERSISAAPWASRCARSW